jgi:hypothetical protein
VAEGEGLGVGLEACDVFYDGLTFVVGVFAYSAPDGFCDGFLRELALAQGKAGGQGLVTVSVVAACAAGYEESFAGERVGGEEGG